MQRKAEHVCDWERAGKKHNSKAQHGQCWCTDAESSPLPFLGCRSTEHKCFMNWTLLLLILFNWAPFKFIFAGLMSPRPMVWAAAEQGHCWRAPAPTHTKPAAPLTGWIFLLLIQMEGSSYSNADRFGWRFPCDSHQGGFFHPCLVFG